MRAITFGRGHGRIRKTIQLQGKSFGSSAQIFRNAAGSWAPGQCPDLRYPEVHEARLPSPWLGRVEIRRWFSRCQGLAPHDARSASIGTSDRPGGCRTSGSAGYSGSIVPIGHRVRRERRNNREPIDKIASVSAAPIVDAGEFTARDIEAAGEAAVATAHNILEEANRSPLS